MPRQPRVEHRPHISLRAARQTARTMLRGVVDVRGGCRRGGGEEDEEHHQGHHGHGRTATCHGRRRVSSLAAVSLDYWKSAGVK